MAPSGRRGSTRSESRPSISWRRTSLRVDRFHNATGAHHHDVEDHQDGDPDGQQHDVQPVHLTEVQDVEERSDAGGVHRVFGVDGDELRVEVLLCEVAGERGENADREDDYADHPGGGPTVAPTGHEVLPPQVQDHEDEEQLNGPEVEAVDEPAEARVMPPLWPHERERDSAYDHPAPRRNRDDSEDIKPRTAVV